MLKILEKTFVVFALMYFAGGLILILQPDNLPTSDDPPANASMAVLRQQEKSSNSDPTNKKVRSCASVAPFPPITYALIDALASNSPGK